MTTIRAGAVTDVGQVRSSNQDQYLVAERIYAVADGMGGHAGGEVASAVAIDALKVSFGAQATADGLADAVRSANQAVLDKADERRDLRGMGTTLTAVALVQDGDDEVLAIVNVGDSRAYLLRDGDFDQLTDDHSVPEVLRRAGRLSQAEAAAHPQRHMLTRVLGEKPDVEVDCFRLTPYEGDRIALASDGLFNEVADQDIARVLRSHDDPNEAAAALVELANEHGGRDNITAVVLHVVDDDGRAAKASAALAGATTEVSAPRAGPVAAPATAKPAPPSRPTAKATAAPTDVTGGQPRGPVRPPPSGPRPARLPSLRALAFVVAVLVVLASAAAAIGWFARAGYFVGQQDGEVVIYKGRAGGLLWFKPTVADRPGVAITDLQESRVADIRAGKDEPSLAAARRYVDNVTKPPPTTTTTTTTTTIAPGPVPPPTPAPAVP